MALPSENLIDLGDLRDRIDARLASGDYGSVHDVVAAALDALDRDEAQKEMLLRVKVHEALTDRRPALPAGQVFDSLEARHRLRTTAGGR